ncbi:hydantoinase B/oxoprolinase family protein, partial [Dissulfurirhabdus thermomarina]
MVSPVDIEVVNRQLASVAEEMGIVLQRSAFSANIKERRDFSCAVFDGAGRLLAQAAHIPVHLGAMPLTVERVLARRRPGPGDVVLTNDPFLGGTHLPDLTLVAGVFAGAADREPLFYLVTRAHHADVGGRTPGSMGLARRIEDEGVRIPPVALVRGGRLDREVLDGFLARVRNPAEREGDLRAQLAALERGRRRLLDLVGREGPESFCRKLPPLLDYGERVMRAAVSALPDGEYRFEDALDDDGLGSRPVPIRVRLLVRGDEAVVDFGASAGQVETGLNTVRSVTCSAVAYVFFCLAGGDYPLNHGSLRPIEVRTRPGSLLDARPPAPVAAGNVETSQRIVDCLLGALAQAAPDRVPAAACGSMNNVAVGGSGGGAGGSGYAYYET